LSTLSAQLQTQRSFSERAGHPDCISEEERRRVAAWGTRPVMHALRASAWEQSPSAPVEALVL